MAGRRSGVKWKSLAGLHWTDEEYDALKTYLRDGIYPEGLSHDQKRDYRVRYQYFTYDKDEDRIVAILNEQPPWSKNPAGEVVLPVDLPLTLVALGQTQREALLEKLWRESGFRASRAVYEKVRKEFLGLPEKVVKAWLDKQTLHQMQRTTKRMIVQPILTSKPFQHWEMDLIDMSEYQGRNDHVHFLLCVLDIFSKFAWVRGLKNKSGVVVAGALQQIILDVAVAPEVISSDNGAEFTSNEMKALAIRFGIHLKNSLPYKPSTQGAVERFNGTLKRSIMSYMGESNTQRYVDQLPFLVKAYNTTKHTTTKATPAEIHYSRSIKENLLHTMVASNIEKAAEKMVERSILKAGNDGELDIGDLVRVDVAALKVERKRQMLVGKKGRPLGWSKEAYVVDEIKQEGEMVKYALADAEDGEPLTEDGVQRWFFRYQLQQIDPGTMKPVGQRRDMWFGKFDSEFHLKELHDKKVERAADIPQAEIERREEAKMEKEIQKLVQEAEGVRVPKPQKKKPEQKGEEAEEEEQPRRSGRSRRAVDHGAVIAH